MPTMRTILFLFLAHSLVVAAERPNIVFLFSDDHALQAISAYGGRLKDIAPTPNIDRLAKEGAIFERSYCANSICGPSRACILTGKHSHINGFLDNDNSHFDGSQPTFPKYLRKSGYQTAIIGKWHLVSNPVGFDHWEILPSQGNYNNPDFIHMDGSTHRETGYVTDIITDKAIDWLQNQRDPKKPFILMCQHKAPHRSWFPAPRHYDLFDGVTIPEPDSLFDNYANRSEVLKEQEMSIAKDFYWAYDMMLPGEPTDPRFLGKFPSGELARLSPELQARYLASNADEDQKLIADLKAGTLSDKDVIRWKYQRYLKNYLRSVRALDENIGRMLDYLDASGLSRNTIVIYSSDQGFYLGEHGWYDKRWMFEESFAMPFLIRWPGVIDPGTRSKALIQNIDYAPTFLELAGIPIPQDIQGRSLVPLFTNGGEAPPDWRKAIYYAYYGEGTHHVAAHDGVRTDRYKLFYVQKTKEWQLFDLEKDPHEMRSVHDDPAYSEVLKDMKQIYQDQRTLYKVK